MATWPLGKAQDEDEEVRRSENEGFGHETEVKDAESENLEAEKEERDLQDIDAEDRDLNDGEVRDGEVFEGGVLDRDLQTTDVHDQYNADGDTDRDGKVDGVHDQDVVEPAALDRDSDLREDDDLAAASDDNDVPLVETPVAEAPVVAVPVAGTPVTESPVNESPVNGTVQDAPTPAAQQEAGGSLLEPGFADQFQGRWRDLQAGFVDDPHETVRKADELATEVVDTLTAALSDRKRGLDERWQAEKDNTEELRLALRGYRQLLDRLVSL